jgi:hypothetical protein
MSRAIHEATIEQLIDWSRNHLLHITEVPPPHDWIDGCHGVVTFYRGLLRAINIPVDYEITFCHGMPITDVTCRRASNRR